MAERVSIAKAPEAQGPAESNTQWALRELEAALRDLRFGQVTITVQDGVVVQVERTERRRFQRGTPKDQRSV
jgi:hypothetical protein